MKHAELFHDPTSLQRGEELVELYIEGFRNYQALQQEDKNLKQHFHARIDEIARQAISGPELHVEDYARIGKAVIDAKLEQTEIDKEREVQKDEGMDLHEIAFASAMLFLDQHAHKPIAAGLLNNEAKGAIYSFGRREPKKVGGFIIPQIIGNARLHISSRSNSSQPRYQLQIFDTFKPQLKIAIGK